MEEKKCKLHVGDYFYYRNPSVVYQVKNIDYDNRKLWTTDDSFLMLEDVNSDITVDITFKTIIQSINDELSE